MFWRSSRIYVTAAAVLLLIASLALAGCASGVASAAETSDGGAVTTSVESASASAETADESTSASTDENEQGLFDSSAIHEIEISFVQEDYDAMIQTYIDTQEKDWIEATVTIDGETYERAGIRLKGNSSLRGLANGRAMGTAGVLSVSEPEGLPWLIRLDKYVDGQNHEGTYELVVRSNNSETALNEAVALELLDMAGLASQEAVSVRLSVNGSDEVLRLVMEHPDDYWMAENLDVGGALYKAESTGDYTYRGDDPDSYDDVFDQEAGKTNADLTPLIEFLDFINNADDATFAADLPERLDIEAFATYLAMQDLVDNFDDIDGPGNNSYLYYDPDEDMFTVVPWDHNLAFGGLGQAGAGGGGAEVRDPRAMGVEPSADQQVQPSADQQTQMDQQVQPSGPPQGGGVRPEGVPEQQDVAGQEAAPGGGHTKYNVLVDRFRSVDEFAALYEEKLAGLRESLYASGAAAEVLERWIDLLETQASDLVTATTVEQEGAKISSYFTVEG